MNVLASESQSGKAWLVGAVIAAVVGGAATVAFAAWWFAEVSGHCGVVRFYEQAFGVILVGGWLAGTSVGLLVVFIGRRRSPKMVVMGSIIVILANIAAVAICAKVVHGVREADYTLKGTEELLGFLTGDNLDARKLSAHALGERRAVEALPPLCAILEDNSEDMNLRHNAAVALGRICAPPRQDGVDVDRALASLTGALKGRDEYLPCSIAQALGDIGDTRAVKPLAEFLVDRSRPIHAREEAARALGNIGGEQARAALMMVRENSDNEDIRNSVERILKTLANEK